MSAKIEIVVPMAGAGSRLAGQSTLAKPLIPVTGNRLMIDLVIDYLRLPVPSRFTFVGRADRDAVHPYRPYLAHQGIDYQLLLAPSLTPGPVATTLVAEASVDPASELLIAYCDGFLAIDVMDFIECMRDEDAAAGAVVYPSSNPTDGYAELDSSGRILRTAEKEMISPTATSCLFYFRRAADYFEAAHATAEQGKWATRELFVSSTLNHVIQAGRPVLSYPIAHAQQIDMGSPATLDRARVRVTEGALEAAL